MTTEIVAGPQQVTVQVDRPVYCPYYSLADGGQGSFAYYQYSAFAHNPFALPASGCSGSPVVYDRGGNFLGFLNDQAIDEATFSYDPFIGLTANVPEGQRLFVARETPWETAWRAYNAEVLAGLEEYRPLDDSAPKWWSDLEYCTWVEQKQLALDRTTATHRVRPFDVLNERFVHDYLDQVESLGYPKGTLTLDHGWGVDPLRTGFGTWRPDDDKFPDFAGLVARIRDRGFTPGLWIGFPKIHPESEAARRFPELVGSAGHNEAGMHYLADAPPLRDYCREVLGRFYKLGFMKFKIDMAYNYKHEQIPVLRSLAAAAKELNAEIEMEFHIPDLFAAQYADVVRTNDIWLAPHLPWQQLVAERYHICLHSAPGRILNLDHLGGNAPNFLTKELFLEHLALYRDKLGYPVVSILPRRLGEECVEALGEYLHDYDKGPRNTLAQF